MIFKALDADDLAARDGHSAETCPDKGEGKVQSGKDKNGT